MITALSLPVVAVALLCMAGIYAFAKLSLPSIFTDHMVLQRDREIPVWGRAPAGEVVTVALEEDVAEGAADVEGRWTVRLRARPARTDPLRLRVEAAGQAVQVDGILVGDVWVCSGQSNMGFALNGVLNAEQEIAEADWPGIRLATVPQVVADTPQDDIDAAWEPCTPETARDFSAVAYFFGRYMHRELGVPVGLINASWGGTPAEAWTPLRVLQAEPELEGVLLRWQDVLARYPRARAEYDELYAEYEKACEHAGRTGRPSPPEPPAPQGPGHCWQPGGPFNAMIAPLIPFAIRGAIWYQGESNAGFGYEYRTLFRRMIESWREAWDQGDFPFMFVQLANFGLVPERPLNSPWAELREAQAMALDLPRTGMAVAIDVGEANDIHPRNKQDVGRRLALAALRVEFGLDVPFSGPMFESMEIEDAAVRVHFKHADGLTTADGEPVRGFALAGEDREWHWADATIEGRSVLVRSDAVRVPAAVRYAWANNPGGNLANAAGLPAAPFRTDDWFGEGPSPGGGGLDYPEPEPVDVPYARDPIAVDGDLSDWENVPAIPLPFHKGRTGRVKLAWREDGLYGAVDADTGPATEGADRIFGGDCIEFWLDKNLDRTLMRTAGSSQYAFGPNPENGPGEGRCCAAYGRDIYREHLLRCAWRPTEKGYTLEFHLPLDVLDPVVPAEGRLLGMNFSLNAKGQPIEQFYSDKDTNSGWSSPITWGIIRLVKD